MTEVEENKALEAMWGKVREWVRAQPRFSKTLECRFPFDTYHWTRLEVYPDGDCAILTGSHGNPGEYMPTMLIGDELFEFHGCSSGMAWYGDKEDLERARTEGRNKTAVEWHKDFRDKTGGFTGYRLMRRLYDNWEYVKSQIVRAVNADAGLRDFAA